MPKRQLLLYRMKKHYLIRDNPVTVQVREGFVHITSNQSLTRAIRDRPTTAVAQLVSQIKEDYLHDFGKPLAITDDSFVVEIWGHFYFERFLLKYSKILRFILIFGLYKRLCRSCEVIDCGERGKDPNRRFWDKLAPFRSQIAKWLPATPAGSAES